MSRPKILFVCGPHCSGKSSILKYLYEKAYLSCWGPEIGKELFYQLHFKTDLQDQKFEFEVSRRELERDREYAEIKGNIGIESWHPGNLAYAAVRNPSVVPLLIAYMKNSPLLADAYGIRLCIDPEVIRERTHTFVQKKDWAVDFYQKIDNRMENCIEQLGLKNRCILIDANQKFVDVIDEVQKAIIAF